jgi:hypothetical protein
MDADPFGEWRVSVKSTRAEFHFNFSIITVNDIRRYDVEVLKHQPEDLCILSAVLFTVDGSPISGFRTFQHSNQTSFWLVLFHTWA